MRNALLRPRCTKPRNARGNPVRGSGIEDGREKLVLPRFAREEGEVRERRRREVRWRVESSLHKRRYETTLRPLTPRLGGIFSRERERERRREAPRRVAPHAFEFHAKFGQFQARLVHFAQPRFIPSRGRVFFRLTRPSVAAVSHGGGERTGVLDRARGPPRRAKAYTSRRRRRFRIHAPSVADA